MDKSVAEILAGVDLFAEDQREHLLDALAVARRDCPVLHTDFDGGYYLVSRHEGASLWRQSWPCGFRRSLGRQRR